MTNWRHTLTRRDTILLLLGAVCMHLVNVLFSPMTTHETSLVINNHVGNGHDIPETPAAEYQDISPPPQLSPPPPPVSSTKQAAHFASELPSTSIMHHAPGYTIFENLYMSNGTLFILSDNARSFPPVRMMISTSLPAENTPENIAAREPTSYIMDFVTPQEAKRRWGGDLANGVRNHVFTVEGNTVLLNDPAQFLRHYYHFVAELFLGLQAFWHGAFSSPIEETIPDPAKSSNFEGRNWNAYPISPQSHHPTMYQLHHESVPPIHRSIFMHANANGWRDDPGFNSYFARAAFPGMSIEHSEDWEDRILATKGGPNARDRAWLFPIAMVVDRSAAFREDITGSHTQRTAAQAWEYMRGAGRLRGERVGGWWEPVRDAVLRFAGAGDALEEYRQLEMQLDGPEDNRVGFSDMAVASGTTLELPLPHRIVVTYISRQRGTRRKLTEDSHAGLVKALQELSVQKGFELNIMEAETLTKDEQLQIIGRTTILLGVHGNGLSHLVFMPPTRFSAVIEIFYPGGFAHDYHWTARALGMPHFAVWNDTYRTHPDEPTVEYPEGFQENYIPVHGPTVAKIIEDRLDDKIGQM